MIDKFYVVQNFETKKYLKYTIDNGYSWDANFEKAKTFIDTDLVVYQYDELDEIFRTSNVFDNTYFEILPIYHVPENNHSNYDEPDERLEVRSTDDDLPF